MAATKLKERLSRRVLNHLPPTQELRAALGEALNEAAALRRLIKAAQDRDLADDRARDREQVGRARR